MSSGSPRASSHPGTPLLDGADTKGENEAWSYYLASATAAHVHPSEPESGLAFWMHRVLEECDQASVAFAADPVHDLRVALRRCRSMADGLMHLDPHKGWKQMKRAGKQLFSSLGELRDVQVMLEWVQKLGDSSDPVTHAFQHFLLQRESELRALAAEALGKFDRKQWATWAQTLPARAHRFHKGSALFQHLALERWSAAYDLHRRAMKSRSQVALHNLRIGVKRFRYIVENFLPTQHAEWKSDLKEVQDILGEVHDLDVLWHSGLQIHAFLDTQSRSQWQAKIKTERERRIRRYREKAIGNDSSWRRWRTELPPQSAVKEIAVQRLRLWASILDPEFKHAEHVTRLSLRILDGLNDGSAAELNDTRALLKLAALMHGVGRSRGAKNHHKQTHRLLSRLTPPMGLTAAELRLVSVVARFYRGRLPQAGEKGMSKLLLAEKRVALRLIAILRLADALDSEHDGRIKSVKLLKQPGFLLLEAEGYSPRDAAAERIAGARHLLEVVCRRPLLIVRPSKRRTRSPQARN